MSTPAQGLKDEADNLFRQQDYSSAWQKYGEAITLDTKNPVLFANRALCGLKLDQYLDAVTDANTAVKLDPGYAKAHARCAEAYEALYLYRLGGKSWVAATKALSKTHLLSSEIKLKAAFDRGLHESALKWHAVASEIAQPSYDFNPAPPWHRAEQIVSRMEKEKVDVADIEGTCALRLASAHRSYTSATLEIAEKLLSGEYSSGQPLRTLTNSLMSDIRAYYDWDDSWKGKILQFMERFNIEHRGWADLKPDEEFFNAVLKRLSEEGWEKLDQALRATIDSWMLRGMVFDKKVDHFDYILQFIEWAESVWDSDTLFGRPSGHCFIFDSRFLLNVKKFRMDMLLEAFEAAEKDTPRKSELLDEALREAEDVVKMADEQNDDLPTPKSKKSVTLLKALCGEGHAGIGRCYQELAQLHPDREDEYNEKAHQSYMEAAKRFPSDDEQHAKNLNFALRCMMKSGRATVGLQLSTTRALAKAVKSMHPVWAVPAYKRQILRYMQTATLASQIFKGKLKKEDTYRWPKMIWNTDCLPPEKHDYADGFQFVFGDFYVYPPDSDDEVGTDSDSDAS